MSAALPDPNQIIESSNGGMRRASEPLEKVVKEATPDVEKGLAELNSNNLVDKSDAINPDLVGKPPEGRGGR